MQRLSLSSTFLAALLAAPVVPILAQEQAPDPSQLKTLEKQLEQTEAERARVQSQASASARAVEAVRSDMIATAKEIQDQENSLTVLESRIAELEREGARLSKILGARDAQMVDVLMAVERLALRPTDALTLTPLSPSDAVRSAILLRAALPSIKQSAVTLQGDLKELYRVRTEVVARREDAAAGAAALVEKHKRLDTLARERTEKHQVLLARGADIDQRMVKVAREAEDLRALFAKLAEEKARRDEEARRLAAEKAAAEAAKAKAEANRITLKPPPGVATPPSPSTSGVSAPKTGSDEESVTRSFAKARGTMPYPVAGSLTGRYGASGQTAGDAGLLAKGITITARAGAQVVAPFDGIVAFSGPFRGYGQLLIIEHSEGYHTLLAGLGHIDVNVGQRVLAGEPVGAMESDGAPTLYVELRRDGQPINPLPWLADRTGKNNG